MNTYMTSEVAKIIGIHPNTVRMYEEWGLIPQADTGIVSVCDRLIVSLNDAEENAKK